MLHSVASSSPPFLMEWTEEENSTNGTDVFRSGDVRTALGYRSSREVCCTEADSEVERNGTPASAEGNLSPLREVCHR